jgi:hypothetical protein
MVTAKTKAENRIGICPGDNCPRSYKVLQDLEDWCIQQNSIRAIPGGGFHGRPPVPAKYSDAMRVVGAEPVFCGECGLELIVSQDLPSLGSCECGIAYGPSDLRQKFHPKCGRPIEISEEVRHAYQRACTVQKVFAGISSAVNSHYIYIPE